MADEHHTGAGIFSFNNKGACPHCHGKGIVVTELVSMDPVTTVCGICEGKHYSGEALSHECRGYNAADIMELTVEDILEFFSGRPKTFRKLCTLHEVGLSYLSLGQSLSALSDGERRRTKLARRLRNKGNISILDKPTTGFHAFDIGSIMKLSEDFIERGNTVTIAEHNPDVMK